MSAYTLIKNFIDRVPLVVRYGGVLSAGLVLLKTIEAQLFSFRYSHDVYSGLLALFFLSLGVFIAYLLFGKKLASDDDNVKPKEPLTATERRVLQGLMEGKSNLQLAEQNHVSVNTVKSHLKNLYRKLGVKNRAAAVAQAKKNTIL